MNYFDFNAFEFGNDEHDAFIKNNKLGKSFLRHNEKKENELNLNRMSSIT